MKILYIGPLCPGGTCLQRMQAMQKLGYEITPIDTEPRTFQKKQKQLFYRIMRKIRGPVDLAGVNQSILQITREKSFDVAWIDKGILLLPEVLQYIKKTTKSLLAHHNTDDITYKSRDFKNYLKAIKIYDVQFTSNTFNIPVMHELGAKKVYFAELAYDDKLFKPIVVSNNDREKLKSDIFFIGHWEPKTEELICCLAKQGLPISVRGQNWHKARNKKLLRNVIKSGPVWEEEYVKALCSGKIGLGIISKCNRNQTAGRIFEIPACGTFLLAERTPSIESLYVECKEAEFFSNSEELLEKVKYYLSHDKERQAIAKAGQERCRTSHYSWKDRVSEMLEKVEEILNGERH